MKYLGESFSAGSSNQHCVRRAGERGREEADTDQKKRQKLFTHLIDQRNECLNDDGGAGHSIVRAGGINANEASSSNYFRASTE